VRAIGDADRPLNLIKTAERKGGAPKSLAIDLRAKCALVLDRVSRVCVMTFVGVRGASGMAATRPTRRRQATVSCTDSSTRAISSSRVTRRQQARRRRPRRLPLLPVPTRRRSSRDAHRRVSRRRWRAVRVGACRVRDVLRAGRARAVTAKCAKALAVIEASNDIKELVPLGQQLKALQPDLVVRLRARVIDLSRAVQPHRTRVLSRPRSRRTRRLLRRRRRASWRC
jgi:hypothetical protein